MLLLPTTSIDKSLINENGANQRDLEGLLQSSIEISFDRNYYDYERSSYWDGIQKNLCDCMPGLIPMAIKTIIQFLRHFYVIDRIHGLQCQCYQ